jgi:hypothetical protein
MEEKASEWYVHFSLLSTATPLAHLNQRDFKHLHLCITNNNADLAII